MTAVASPSAPPAAAGASHGNLLRWLGAVTLVVAVGAVYAPAIGGGWLWDDNTEITANLELRDPAGWWRAWIAPSGADYFPLKTLVQWVEWHLWADRSPVGYHLVSVGLHLLSAFLLWRILRRLGLRYAWGGAMVFAIHPLAVESVAWIAELKNTLSLPLLLLSVDAWLDFDATGRRTAALRVLAWFLMASLAKTSVVMLPCFLVGYEWWRHGAVKRTAAIPIAGLVVIAGALGAVTLWFQYHHALNGWSLPDATWPARAWHALLAVGFYAGKCVWPFALAPIYPRWPPGMVAVSALFALLFVASGCIAWRRRTGGGRHVLLGLGWFALNLLPVVGLLGMAYLHLAPVADHFAYVALPAFAALLAATLGELRARGHGGSAGMPAIAAALVLALAATAQRQARYYADPAALWTHALALNPRAWPAQQNLGVLAMDRGDWEGAARHLEAAARLGPEEPAVQINLGNAEAHLGRLAPAIAAAQKAVALDPPSVAARVNLGNLLLQSGDFTAAVTAYEDARRRSSRESLDLEYNLGNALLRAGRPADAAEHYRTACRLKPDFAEAHLNLGYALASRGDSAGAITELACAVQCAPRNFDARYALGDALLTAGRPAAAVEHLRAAVALAPDQVEVRMALGTALLSSGRAAEAEAQFAAVLQRQPDHRDAAEALLRCRTLPSEPPERRP